MVLLLDDHAFTGFWLTAAKRPFPNLIETDSWAQVPQGLGRREIRHLRNDGHSACACIHIRDCDPHRPRPDVVAGGGSFSSPRSTSRAGAASADQTDASHQRAVGPQRPIGGAEAAPLRCPSLPDFAAMPTDSAVEKRGRASVESTAWQRKLLRSFSSECGLLNFRDRTGDPIYLPRHILLGVPASRSGLGSHSSRCGAEPIGDRDEKLHFPKQPGGTEHRVRPWRPAARTS